MPVKKIKKIFDTISAVCQKSSIYNKHFLLLQEKWLLFVKSYIIVSYVFGPMLSFIKSVAAGIVYP